MSGKIPKIALKGLADKIRQTPTALQNLRFADSTTSITAVQTTDLRFDVHKSTVDPNMATGIIQANSGAKDKGVKAFIKGKTGGHRGTHQVIGEKIRFSLGYDLQVEEVAAAVENPDFDGGQLASYQGEAGGSGSGSGSGSGLGLGPTSTDWVWWSDEGIWHHQTDGVDAWYAPESSADSDWIYSNRTRKYFIKYANGTVLWQ